MDKDNIHLIQRLDKVVGMHLVLLVGLAVVNIMDRKEGMVVGEGIHLGCEFGRDVLRRKGRKDVLDM